MYTDVHTFHFRKCHFCFKLLFFVNWKATKCEPYEKEATMSQIFTAEGNQGISILRKQDRN